MRSILAVLVLAALALAQAEAKQVTFDDSVRGEGNAPAIFMDRAGELYPPAPVRGATYLYAQLRGIRGHECPGRWFCFGANVRNADDPFWGCSIYLRCRGSLPG